MAVLAVDFDAVAHAGYGLAADPAHEDSFPGLLGEFQVLVSQDRTVTWTAGASKTKGLRREHAGYVPQTPPKAKRTA
ncbi:hypothetical protein JCM14713_11460 [Desulfomicrobium salsuginis]